MPQLGPLANYCLIAKIVAIRDGEVRIAARTLNKHFGKFANNIYWMICDMTIILAIPLGIILGWILHKIGDKHPTITYLIGILPYSIFFWLTWDDRDFWGPYRISALFGSILAIIIWKTLDALSKKHWKLKENGKRQL